MLSHFLYLCEDFVNEQDAKRVLPLRHKKHIARAILKIVEVQETAAYLAYVRIS